MTKKKYRRYSPEFKRHALKRASEKLSAVPNRGIRSIRTGDVRLKETR